ncbi:glycosyltransferase [Clostridium tyrobutyricum]|uniref:Glycosyltransferase 2-like domain-containing protein n=1 Tax=Clostridium tyrobutyricum DIVETGP TaxID=1408889 RepID=W6N4Y7_CLOTY|nr:glycosyltransferase [Clostridium tyrobutyricum]AND85385.1 glycosyltransferase [Clostridium tyrobutyricum]ANP69933.1 hypothetical protein BA182_09650 [Clostridium tyrobutyricum]MBV4433987.1 glycosyltransferase [Clostridium tyrobutyricum]QNB65705.1 glycosyltransferase [Clostridium tyrobutyricum]CDL91658.1 hypothetical protein CTDIVETGP_1728 [Clostridium tyrobutyricum DIVETGP]
MKNKLLLMFNDDIFKNDNEYLSKIDEQLQISMQILINKGYEISVTGDSEQSIEFAMKFSNAFYDENIRNIEIGQDYSKKVELINDSNCVVCFHKNDLMLVEEYNKPFIFIDICEKNDVESEDILNNLGRISVKDLNAGEIVKNVAEALKTELKVNEKNKSRSNDEFEQYKKQVKKTIEQLINENKLDEAKSIIDEYEEIVKDDVDIYSMGAIIAITENRLSDAESILKEGIKLYDNNFDLIYNLAYVYEKMSRYSDSAIYYGLAEKYNNSQLIKGRLDSIYLNNNSLLKIKKCVKNSPKKTFIILSSCGFTEILQRMHHISKSLVKFGHDVIYIPPSINVSANTKQIKLNSILQYIISNKKMVEGVKIYQPLNVNYENQFLYGSYTELVQYFINNSNNEVTIIAYMPYQVNVIKNLNGKFKVIYECVDDHTDLKYAFWGNKKDVVWEQELMDISDGITTTAISLYLQRVSIEGRKKVYLSRNAVNESDFIINENEKIPEDLKDIPEPRIVYTGAIYDWFDKELFYNVVRSNPDKSFVVIGFGNNKILKEKCNNLYLLGAKKHSDLKKYLRHSQIGIIPFKDDTDLIINCDPIKQYEYIACGLPVITTFMPESAIGKIYTYIANTKESFNSAIKKCLDLKIDQNKIKNFLIENSWNNKAALLCNIIDKNVYDEEKKYLLENIKDKLFYICNKYNSNIFKTLKGIYLNLEDNEEAEKCLKQVYEKNKHKYIEKQYLTILLKNKNIDTFINVVKDSRYITKELKNEILYVNKLNLKKSLNVILYLCIQDIKNARIQINNINNDFKIIYQLYIKYLLGEKFEFNRIEKIELKVRNFPLFKFMKKQAHMEQLSSNSVNLSKNPFISILIPTRNSADVLRYTLMTCIKQNYYNYEIIISDNSSRGNNETKNLVNEFNCKKIKYYRTPKDYAMIENYEFAYSKANGDYMILIGSDDGLLLHCLEIIPKIIKKLNNPLSITWDPIAYGWPEVKINSIKNGLFIPYPSQKSNIKYNYYDESVLKSVLNFEARYSILPMFYYNSIIKRELIEKVKKISKKIFCASPPDVYTGIVFCYLEKKYIHINMPMTIGGSSQRSIGIMAPNFIYKKSFNDINSKFELEKEKSMGMDCNKFFSPYFAGEESSVLRTGILAKQIFFNDSKDFNVNMKNFYKACCKYLFNDETFFRKKKELYDCILKFGDKNIIKWYEENYFYNKTFKGYNNYNLQPLTPIFSENRRLIIDASKFNVNNVFEAAKLYRKIVGY